MVAHQSIDHLIPIEFPCAPVIIESWVSRIGGASFTLDYVMLDSADESRVYAKAKSVLVPFNQETHKSRRLTDREREVLGWFLREE